MGDFGKVNSLKAPNKIRLFRLLVHKGDPPFSCLPEGPDGIEDGPPVVHIHGGDARSLEIIADPDQRHHLNNLTALFPG